MKVAVMGSGSWGTVISQVISDAGSDVTLWSRSQEVATAINETHRNPSRLPDHQ